MYPKRHRHELAEVEQEKSLQVAADVGHDVTLIDDVLFESEDENAASKVKIPAFIAICDRIEVRKNFPATFMIQRFEGS